MTVFHIVGCNHGIQVGSSGFGEFDSADQKEQRRRFRELLDGICDRTGTEVVLEENGGPEETAAEQIAKGHRIPWYDINTTNEDKDRLGIPRNYVDEPHAEDQKEEWHRLRERVMVQKIKQHARYDQSVLIVCGFDHMSHIAELLQQGAVAVEDYRERTWYRPGLFAGER